MYTAPSNGFYLDLWRCINALLLINRLLTDIILTA